MDWHELWRRRLPAEPGGLSDGEVPDAGRGPIRYLHIVARTRLDLFLTMRRRFRDDRSVHVMLDRRERDRRRQSRPVTFADRRQAPDRRHPRDYWEDLAHHPAVMIPLGPRQPERGDPAAPPAAVAAPQPSEPAPDPGLTHERLLSWVEESRQIIEQVLPAVVRERDAGRTRLEEADRRYREVQKDNEWLRAEVTRLTQVNRRLGEEQAEAIRGLGRFITQVTGALQALHEIHERQARAMTAGSAAAPPASAGPTAAGRVLVVDPEPAGATALRDALAQAGYATQIAACGREALEMVPAFEPDVIVLDVAVPDLPGVEMIEELRRLDPALPVVLASTAEREEDALGLLARGAFDYLSKPFTLDVVERVVAAAVARRQA